MMNKDLKLIIFSIVMILLGFCSPHIALKTILIIFGVLLFIGSVSNSKKKSKNETPKRNILPNNYSVNEKKESSIETKERILNEEMELLLNRFNNDFYNEKKAYTDNYCPNCGVVFEKKINSSKTCKECKKGIYIFTNKIDKEKYLIGQDKYSLLSTYKIEIEEIMFYERLLKSLSKATNVIFKEIKKARDNCKSGIVRDIVWMAINSSMNYHQNESMKQIMKCYEIKDFVDKLQYFSNYCSHSLFYYERCLYSMYEVADYKNQYEVAQELFATYIYHSIVDHMLYYGFNDIAKIDYESIYTYCFPSMVIQFMDEYEMTLEDFKKLFISRARNHFVGGISKNEAYGFIEESIKWYKSFNDKK